MAVLNPFIDLISNIIFLINLALTIWIVLGLLIHFDIVNRHSPIVARVYGTLSRLLEPMLGRIRRALGKFLPDLGGIDLSPIILILLLRFIDSLMYSWFFRI
ncbi:MAG: YggT family protein [Rickettsiales bacterium]